MTTIAPERSRSFVGETHAHLFGLSGAEGYRKRPAVRVEGLTLTAAADGAKGWHGILCVEGVRTSDHRELANGSVSWRPLPLPIALLTKTSWGHEGAEVCGRIDSIDKVNNQLVASGIFADSDAGREAASLLEQGIVRWFSVDLEIFESTLIEVIVDPLYDDWGDLLGGDIEWWERIDKANIGMATLCPFPAFLQAVAAPEGQPLPETPADNGLPTLTSSGLLASGARVETPPAEWFADPHLPGPRALTITDEGQVFGHVAAWDVAHIGLPVPTYAPHTATGYRYFLRSTANEVWPDADPIPVGVLTAGTGHAADGIAMGAAREHYDNTGACVAAVSVGEDDHGIWMAGALTPDATDAQVRTLRLVRSVSGDWRMVGGNYELMAVLGVNVPGFPILENIAASGQVITLPTEMGPRVGFRSGKPTSLVAAGIVRNDPVGDALRRMARQIGDMSAVVDALRPLAAERLVDRVLARS